MSASSDAPVTPRDLAGMIEQALAGLDPAPDYSLTTWRPIEGSRGPTIVVRYGRAVLLVRVEHATERTYP